jgi:hypothetical protein
MNDLQRYFENNAGNLIDKHLHYFEIYDRFFSKYRGTDVNFVEIGIYNGGSLSMWKDYFGPKATIYGVDINPECKKFEGEQIKIFIGDQADKVFLNRLVKEIPRIDVLLDDGGHTMEQMINTFEVLYPAVDKNGIFACEDLHTCYWKRYGGGYRRRGTFIEYSKHFIDYLHAWHSRRVRGLRIENFIKSTYGLHYFDSILVIEKRPMSESVSRQVGTPTLTPLHPMSFWQRALRYARVMGLVQYRALLHQLRYRPYHRSADKDRK